MSDPALPTTLDGSTVSSSTTAVAPTAATTTTTDTTNLERCSQQINPPSSCSTQPITPPLGVPATTTDNHSVASTVLSDNLTQTQKANDTTPAATRLTLTPLSITPLSIPPLPLTTTTSSLSSSSTNIALLSPTNIKKFMQEKWSTVETSVMSATKQRMDNLEKLQQQMLDIQKQMEQEREADIKTKIDLQVQMMDEYEAYTDVTAMIQKYPFLKRLKIYECLHFLALCNGSDGVEEKQRLDDFRQLLKTKIYQEQDDEMNQKAHDTTPSPATTTSNGRTTRHSKNLHQPAATRKSTNTHNQSVQSPHIDPTQTESGSKNARAHSSSASSASSPAAPAAAKATVKATVIPSENNLDDDENDAKFLISLASGSSSNLTSNNNNNAQRQVRVRLGDGIIKQKSPISSFYYKSNHQFDMLMPIDASLSLSENIQVLLKWMSRHNRLFQGPPPARQVSELSFRLFRDPVSPKTPPQEIKLVSEITNHQGNDGTVYLLSHDMTVDKYATLFIYRDAGDKPDSFQFSYIDHPHPSPATIQPIHTIIKSVFGMSGDITYQKLDSGQIAIQSSKAYARVITNSYRNAPRSGVYTTTGQQQKADKNHANHNKHNDSDMTDPNDQDADAEPMQIEEANKQQTTKHVSNQLNNDATSRDKPGDNDSDDKNDHNDDDIDDGEEQNSNSDDKEDDDDNDDNVVTISESEQDEEEQQPQSSATRKRKKRSLLKGAHPKEIKRSTKRSRRVTASPTKPKPVTKQTRKSTPNATKASSVSAPPKQSPTGSRTLAQTARSPTNPGPSSSTTNTTSPSSSNSNKHSEKVAPSSSNTSASGSKTATTTNNNNNIADQHNVQVVVPSQLRKVFLQAANENTNIKKIETIGRLWGQVVESEPIKTSNSSSNNNTLVKDHDNQTTKIIIKLVELPPQKGTSDTCKELNTSLPEPRDGLIHIGNIHTHPVHDCFMSAQDIITQCNYQMLHPHFISIVMAPTDTNMLHNIYNVTHQAIVVFKKFNGMPDESSLHKMYTIASHAEWDDALDIRIEDNRQAGK